MWNIKSAWEQCRKHGILMHKFHTWTLLETRIKRTNISGSLDSSFHQNYCRNLIHQFSVLIFSIWVLVYKELHKGDLTKQTITRTYWRCCFLSWGGGLKECLSIKNVISCILLNFYAWLWKFWWQADCITELVLFTVVWRKNKFSVSVQIKIIWPLTWG